MTPKTCLLRAREDDLQLPASSSLRAVGLIPLGCKPYGGRKPSRRPSSLRAVGFTSRRPSFIRFLNGNPRSPLNWLV